MVKAPKIAREIFLKPKGKIPKKPQESKGNEAEGRV